MHSGCACVKNMIKLIYLNRPLCALCLYCAFCECNYCSGYGAWICSLCVCVCEIVKLVTYATVLGN